MHGFCVIFKKMNVHGTPEEETLKFRVIVIQTSTRNDKQNPLRLININLYMNVFSVKRFPPPCQRACIAFRICR